MDNRIIERGERKREKGAVKEKIDGTFSFLFSPFIFNSPFFFPFISRIKKKMAAFMPPLRNASSPPPSTGVIGFRYTRGGEGEGDRTITDDDSVRLY